MDNYSLVPSWFYSPCDKALLQDLMVPHAPYAQFDWDVCGDCNFLDKPRGLRICRLGVENECTFNPRPYCSHSDFFCRNNGFNNVLYDAIL